MTQSVLAQTNYSAGNEVGSSNIGINYVFVGYRAGNKNTASRGNSLLNDFSSRLSTLEGIVNKLCVQSWKLF